MVMTHHVLTPPSSQKSTNSSDNFHIQLSSDIIQLSLNNLRKILTPVRAHLCYTTQLPLCSTSIHPFCIWCLIAIQRGSPTKQHQYCFTCCVSYWPSLHFHATIHYFMYQCIHNFIHTHTCTYFFHYSEHSLHTWINHRHFIPNIEIYVLNHRFLELSILPLAIGPETFLIYPL
jgi:hypothetical protein